MARLFTDGPKSGLLSGKIGDLVYVVKNGKNYMRRSPQQRSKNNFSPLQKTQQMRFKRASTLARQLLPIFRIGNPQITSEHYPLLMKQLLQILHTTGENATDWPELQLSDGQIHLNILTQKKHDQLIIQLENGKKGYTFHYVFLEQEADRIHYFCDKQSEFRLPIPPQDGHYHLFLFVVNEAENDCSPTYYLGEYLMQQGKAKLV